MYKAQVLASRGKLFTLILILSLILLLIKAFFTFGKLGLNIIYTNSHSWYPPLMTFYEWSTLLILAVALFGIFKWKKWGVYLLFLGIIFGLLYNITVWYFVDWPLGIGGIIRSIGAAILWYFIIFVSKKWNSFS